MLYLILAASLIAVPALAQTFTDQYGRAVTCTPATGGVSCSSADGLTVTTQTPAQASGVFNGMAPSTWVPPAPPAPATIDPLSFINRLTPEEQAAITSAGQSNVQVQLWLMKLASAQQVNVTDPLTIGGVNAMVAAGLLTAPRAAQILNLSVASP